MKPLPDTFYARSTVTVARDLLGKTLVRNIDGKLLSGIITETEAYGFLDDPASHCFRGLTQRNKAMFGEIGRAYVYFTYGMHYCVNAVAKSKKSKAGAVLIRAIQPKQGIEQMIQNRNKTVLARLTDGPAKLTQALQISKEQYGVKLTEAGELFIATGLVTKKKIICSPRIGIKKAVDKLWNFKIIL